MKRFDSPFQPNLSGFTVYRHSTDKLLAASARMLHATVLSYYKDLAPKA